MKKSAAGLIYRKSYLSEAKIEIQEEKGSSLKGSTQENHKKSNRGTKTQACVEIETLLDNDCEEKSCNSKN